MPTRPGLMTMVAIGMALSSGGTAPAEGVAKNWRPPAYKTLAQALTDATMAAHPELLSMTFHGTPPGMDKIYTMFAGSYPDRIGNPDDPDDVDVIVKGITIVDPRWKRTKDAVPKFVMQMPLRDAAGQNVGLIVYAFKSTAEAAVFPGGDGPARRPGADDPYLRRPIRQSTLAAPPLVIRGSP